MGISAKFFIFTFLLSCLAGNTAIYSQEIVIDRYQIERDVSEEWQIYFDSSNSLGLKDIRQLPETSWKTQESLGMEQNESVWLRAKVKNRLASPMTLYFQIPTLNIHQIHYYVFQKDLHQKVVKTGESYPFRNRDVYTPRYNFRLNLEAGETKTIYFRLQNPGFKTIFLSLYDQKTFEEMLFRELVIKSLSFGSLAAFALVYIALAINLRRKRYLYYACWILMLVLLYMRADGFTFGEFGRDIFWWNQWNILFYCLMAHVFLLLFLREPSLSGHILPGLKRPLLWSAFSILMVIPLTAIYYRPVLNAIAVLSLLLVVSLTWSIAIGLYRKQKSWNRLFTGIAVHLLLILVSIVILRFTIFQQSWLMDSMVYHVVLGECVLLIFALQEVFEQMSSSPALINPHPVLKNAKVDIEPLMSLPTANLAHEATSNSSATDLIQSEKLASLGTLTNGLAHELNNPLAIIAGHQYRLQALAKRGTVTPRDITSSMEKVGQAVKRILSIVDALKVYSQDSRGVADFRPINIRESVQYALDLCRERLVSLGINLSTQPIPDILIEGNQGQIMQVLLTLIENAVDAVRQHEDKTIAIEFQQSVTMLEISVIDNGSGVAAGEESKIFDPFYSKSPSAEKKGLGLSVASGIVARHGGKLYLDRQHPLTRFVLRLRR
ncbi:MAG: sensor histidine kinase [Oligoflexus sp.]